MLEVPELKHITARLEEDGQFCEALSNVDSGLVNKAVGALSEIFPIVHTRGRPEQLSQFLEWQLFERLRKFSTYVIFRQVDNSGLSAAIARLAPELLAEFDFRACPELQDVELSLVSSFGVTRDDMNAICDLADKHWKQVLGAMQESGESFRMSPVIERDPPGTQAAGGILAAVNVAGALAPEPFVSKGIAVASTVAGFLAAWFGD